MRSIFGIRRTSSEKRETSLSDTSRSNMCQNKHHSNAFKKETEFDYNLYMEIQDSTSVPDL